MPYKVETQKIKLGDYDRRKKLNEEDKENILKDYKSGLFSQRSLARKYEVSRFTIAIIVNPKRAEYVKNRTKTHWREYCDRAKLTEAVRETRRYKHKLYIEGKIKEEQ